MIQYNREFKDYCPKCGKEQQYITNPMYMHICTECGEKYGMSDLIQKEIIKINSLYKCLRYIDEEERHSGALLVMAKTPSEALQLAKDSGDIWDCFYKAVKIDGVISEGKSRVIYDDYSR
jgi:ssDNA-binding Zn-finger/Zn-ribbon topoisomerase 1